MKSVPRYPRIRHVLHLVGVSGLIVMVCISALKLGRTSVTQLKARNWEAGVEAYAPIFVSLGNDVGDTGRLGYVCGVSDDELWTGGTEEAMYFMSQYYLAPRLVITPTPHPLVKSEGAREYNHAVGFFRNKPSLDALLRTSDWVMVKGYGRGVFLLRKRSVGER